MGCGRWLQGQGTGTFPGVERAVCCLFPNEVSRIFKRKFWSFRLEIIGKVPAGAVPLCRIRVFRRAVPCARKVGKGFLGVFNAVFFQAVEGRFVAAARGIVRRGGGKLPGRRLALGCGSGRLRNAGP